MDRTDAAILSALGDNCRQSFAELSEKVGLSKTPCWARVQTLEKSGAIRGYHADIQPAALGLHVMAYVQVMIDFSRRADFETAVISEASIVDCATTAGEADYILKVVCKDVDGLDDLLRYRISLLPGLQRSTTMICLKSIKHFTNLTQAALRPVK
jgi:Lrp/AsnC family leucine-responsive transcriptional regulator